MEIKNSPDYKRALRKVYNLMNKGEDITDAEANEIEKLANAIEEYEDGILKIMPLPVAVNSARSEKDRDGR